MVLIRSQKLLFLYLIVLLVHTTSTIIEGKAECRLITRKHKYAYITVSHTYFSCNHLKSTEDFQKAYAKECLESQIELSSKTNICHRVKDLQITSSILEKPSWKFIREKFPNLGKLSFVDSTLNNIGEEGACTHNYEQIVECTEEDSPCPVDQAACIYDLGYLLFSNNTLRNVRNVTEVLQSLTVLSELHIERNPFESFTLSNVSALRELYLNDNALRKVILGNMVNVERLDLSGNILESLDGSDINLPSIKYLNLSRNQLGDFNNKHIYEKDWDELAELDLSYNKLRTLEAEAMKAMRWLRRIHLDHNSLTSFPPGLFESNAHLIWITASHNNLRDLPIDLFPGMFNVPLMIDFSHNSIREIKPETFRIRDDNSETTTYINTINLANNDLREIDLTIFQRTTTEFLYISHNNLEELNLSELTCDIDASHNQIEKLLYTKNSAKPVISVSHIQLDHNIIKNLEPGMFQSFPVLQNLTLSYNNIDELSDGTFFGLSYLEILDLGNNNLTSLHADILGPLHRLHTLILYGNLFTTLDLVKFADLLPKLEVFDIDQNRWSCAHLRDMISTFRHKIKRHISLVRDIKPDVVYPNVDGVICSGKLGSSYFVFAIVFSSFIVILGVFIVFCIVFQRNRRRQNERRITEESSRMTDERDL